MSVTDNQGSNSIRQAICDGNASAAANSGIFNGASPSKTVQWTESHDTYKDSGTRYVSDDNINKTWAIVGARDEVCGQYLARPSDIEASMLGAADVTSWASTEVRAINQFKNNFRGESEYFSSYNSLACVERGTSGMIIVNTGGTYYDGMSAPVHTMASGTYKDAITGNTFTVSDGYISGDIGNSGIAVIYDTSSSGTLEKGNVTAISLPGTFNGWDQSADYMIANDSNTASVTMFLDKGDYEFKVKAGDIWYGNSGTIADTTTTTSSSGWTMSSSESKNCKLSASGGKYTFTFNISTGKLIVEYENTTDKTSDYYVKGSFNGWDTSAPMKYTDGSNTVSATIDIAAGTHTFKLNNIESGVWYGKDSTITDNTTDSSSVGWTFYTDEGNCTLEASGGTYKFTFNLSTQKLIIEHTKDSDTETQVKEYTVTFKDFDGTVLDTQTVTEGESAVAPADPQREADAQYTYTFSGWDQDFTNITGNLTVTATYTETVNKYTVTFKDYDGTVLSTQSVAYGSAATAPADPEREGYTFSGWDVSFDNITADTTVTAIYSDDTVYLRGSFNDWELTTPMASATGTTVSTTLELEAGTYTFKIYQNETWYGNNGTIADTTTATSSSGWVMETGKGNCTLEATGGTYTFNYDTSSAKLIVLYEAPTYTVTFKDYDGTVLSTQSVAYGTSATAPANPTREGDAQYSYTFKAWDKDFSNITGDLTVTATYTQTVNKYTVTFKNYDGTVLSTQSVAYGSSATAPANPTREGNAQYSYTFKAWDKDFSNITGDLTVTATYTQTVNKYTVTFKDYDGTVLDTQSVAYGSSATAPADPEREGYVFEGWDKSFANITGDLTVTATYTDATDVYYTVTFKDYNGTVLKTESVAHGSSATPPLEPLRASTSSGWTTTYYIFDSWDTDYTNIQADTTVTAVYKSVNSNFMNRVYYYFVYFKDYDGTILKQQNVKSGTTVTPPADPTRDGYTFAGWDNTDFTITAETTFTATYTENTESYTVTFKDYDGKVLSTQTVKEGESAIAPANPTREGNAQYSYTFKAWDKDFSNITGDLTVTATYTQTVNKYTVTFTDYDGTVLRTQSVAYGSSATAPANPTREGYTFSGWNTSFNSVTADTTVTAAYTQNATEVKRGILRIDVTGGSGFTISVNGGTARPQGTSYLNTKFAIGSVVTIEAKASSEATFVGWLNASDNLIITTETTYTFTSTGNDSYKAMYLNEVENVNVVRFMNDKSKQILDMQYYAAGETIEFPAYPTQAGFKVTGWSMTAEDIQAELAAGRDVTVTPVWERVQVYVNITANGGTLSNGNGSYLLTGYLTATAAAPEAGMKFAYWVDQDGVVKSYDAEYGFFAAKDTELTAIYVAEEAEIEYEIIVNVDVIDTVTYDSTNATIFSWYVAEEELGIKFVKSGMVSVNKNNYNEATFVAGTTDANVYDRGPKIGTTDNVPVGAYSWTKSNVQSGDTWMSRAYVQYTIEGDTSGTVYTVYSDIVEATRY